MSCCSDAEKKRGAGRNLLEINAFSVKVSQELIVGVDDSVGVSDDSVGGSVGGSVVERP